MHTTTIFLLHAPKHRNLNRKTMSAVFLSGSSKGNQNGSVDSRYSLIGQSEAPSTQSKHQIMSAQTDAKSFTLTVSVPEVVEKHEGHAVGLQVRLSVDWGRERPRAAPRDQTGVQAFKKHRTCLGGGGRLAE